MAEQKVRGLLPQDQTEFHLNKIEKLKSAQQDLQFLLNRGYPKKSAMTFVGNHHQLTVRQSLAIMRATASATEIKNRELKRMSPEQLQGKTMYIDGFNLLITLEVALSDGMLFAGQDRCIRDLAQLRGTYRLIPQTTGAIVLVQQAAQNLCVEKVIFYLDKPVSNSGRLKQEILSKNWGVDVQVEIVQSPDFLLKQKENVVTADAIILDECKSWFNLTQYIFHTNMCFDKLTRFIKLF